MTIDKRGVAANSHLNDIDRRPHAPRKTPRQARSRHLVQAILEAAARVFDEHGYANGNTNRIAEMAGVSVGSLYQYFPNKKALVSALHDLHIQEVARLMTDELSQHAVQASGDLIDRLIAALMQAHQDRPRLQRVLHTELPFYKPPDAIARWISEPARLLRIWLGNPQDETPSMDIDHTASMLLHMGEALVHAAVLCPPPGLSSPEVAAHIARALKGYLATRVPPPLTEQC